MYIAMTQEEYEQVPREAIETVANRIGIASESYDPDLFSKIEKLILWLRVCLIGIPTSTQIGGSLLTRLHKVDPRKI